MINKIIFIQKMTFVIFIILAPQNPSHAQQTQKVSGAVLNGALPRSIRIELALPPIMDIGLTPVERNLRRSETIRDSINKFTPRIIETGAHIEQAFAFLPYIYVRIESLDQLLKLADNPSVLRIEPERIYKPSSVPLSPAHAQIGSNISREFGHIGSGKTIVLIDSGVDQTSPAFAACNAASPSACCPIVADRHVALLNPNTADEYSHPGLRCEGDEEVLGADHGTDMAEIITAVAPGANILSLDVGTTHQPFFGGQMECVFRQSMIDFAYDWVLQNASSLGDMVAVNLSFAGVAGGIFEPGEFEGFTEEDCPRDNDAAFAALRELGITPIAASGGGGFADKLTYPACSPLALSVGATYDSRPEVNTNANTALFLDLLAPGSRGPSEAAARVSAAWSIMRQSRPSLSMDELEDTLKTTGRLVTDARSGLEFPLVKLQQALDLPPIIPDRHQSMERFGSSFTASDFNRDGRTDLAVGVPRQAVKGKSGAGAVNILYGTSSRLLSEYHNPETNQISRLQFLHLGFGARADDRFGTTLASGDFNGDQFPDLAVGALFASIGSFDGAGTVYVYHGSMAGFSEPTQKLSYSNLESQLAIPLSTDRLGAALAVGNFNNDAFDDLVIGVPFAPRVQPGFDPMHGVVHVVYGTVDGLNAADSQLLLQGGDIAGVGEAYDLFGSALAAGDFNGDGYDDLAIGVPGESIGDTGGAGAVNVIFGGVEGLSGVHDEIWHEDKPNVPDTAEPGDRFGWALAAGNFNNDGADDLAIGVPLEDDQEFSDSGAVQILYGTQIGLNPFSHIPESERRLTSASHKRSNGEFGRALSSGNYDGDLYDDLAIGIPGATFFQSVDPHHGAVRVEYGSGRGLGRDRPPQQWYQNAGSGNHGVGEYAEAEDRFGLVLASGDFDADDFEDLAIGTPLEDIPANTRRTRPGCAPDGASRQAGMVNVILGSLEGLFNLTTVSSYDDDLPLGAAQSQILVQGVR